LGNIKMSKYSDEFGSMQIKEARARTNEMIKDGSKLALESFHDAQSLERLKKIIKIK